MRTFSFFLVGFLITFAVVAQNKPRVLILDRDEWQVSGSVAGSNGTIVGHEEGRTVRSHTEETKSLNKACPNVTITLDEKLADYIIVWDHKTWAQTSWAGHQNEVAIYDQRKDLCATLAAHKMDSAAKNICKAILERWKAN